MSRSSTSSAAFRVKPWPPRWLSPVPKQAVRAGDGSCSGRSDCPCACCWVEAFCRTTKDSISGPAKQSIFLREWQRELYAGLLARKPDGRLRHRYGLIGVARKNGKSEGIGAPLALYALLSGYPDGPQGREVYSCAGDRMQAGIVFEGAKKMVEMEPELSSVCRIYRNAIEVPKTGSVYRALSAEAYSKEGLNPTFVLFDEVHVQPNRELWDVMALAMGARPEPMMVGITTAGVRYDALGKDTLCYQLYEHGKRVASGEVVDPSFYFAWWEPKDSQADHRDPRTWAESNPGLGDIVAEEDFESAVAKTPEAEFRTKRCNQWVVSQHAWLPNGAWDVLTDEQREIPLGARIVLGFDGSFSNDATGIVAVSIPDDEFEQPIVEVVELWERPAEADDDWRVPIDEVEEMIRLVCRVYEVIEIACDPYRWARTFQALEEQGLPVVEFPNSPERMVPAVQRAYEGVVNRSFTHNGDPRLARHLGNAVTKDGPRGTYISRISRSHNRGHRPYMDLAIAFVMAYHRACWWQAQEEPEPMIAVGR